MEWALASGIEEGDPYFSRYQKGNNGVVYKKMLTSKMMGSFFKECSEQDNLPQGTYTGHSMRMGGASEMCRNGFNIEAMNTAGRWADGSTAAIRYRLPLDRTIEALSSLIPNALGEQSIVHNIRSVAMPKKRKPRK
jgi:hypothetical protein